MTDDYIPERAAEPDTEQLPAAEPAQTVTVPAPAIKSKVRSAWYGVAAGIAAAVIVYGVTQGILTYEDVDSFIDLLVKLLPIMVATPSLVGSVISLRTLTPDPTQDGS